MNRFNQKNLRLVIAVLVLVTFLTTQGAVLAAAGGGLMARWGLIGDQGPTRLRAASPARP